MRWRTEARSGARRRGLTRAHSVVTLCTVAALGVIPALPARAAPANPAADGTPPPYAFAPDARTVRGATGTTDAARLDPGHTYRAALPAAGRLYYRLDLDASTDAYVSATAVPRAGAQVSASDGLRVSVQDADGTTCSSGTTHFGPTQSPHPIAAWAARETGPGGYGCKDAGVYYAVVERRDLSGSATGAWDLELDYVSESSVRGADATATAPPGAWNSATPDPLLGDPTRRAGGAGFATASALAQGVWQDAIRPGQTLFYKVPVDWGQQLSATAELGSSPGGSFGGGYVGTALAMALYNPVRAHVDDATTGYGGTQTSAALTPLPPVAYANRHAVGDRTSGMRFAGWYYLVVHLAAPVAQRFGDGPFGLTLRVRVSGTATPPPAYAGWSAPRDVFRVTAADRLDAAAGTGGGGSGGGEGTAAPGGGGYGEPRTMTLVAVGGIGTGTALVLVLVGWTVAARRRARSRWAG